MAPLGIQPRQARIIDILSHMAPVSQAEIAEAFGITAASMSIMTDRLLAAGFISRTVDPMSRRRRVIDLTPSGRTLLDGIEKAWSEVDAHLRATMAPNADPFFQQARALRDDLGGKIPGKR